MKLKEGFYLERSEGQNIIKCCDAAKMHNLITLNSHTAFLFKCLEDGEKSKEELLNLMLQNLDVSTVLALSDIDVFVKTLRENGIIEE